MIFANCFSKSACRSQRYLVPIWLEVRLSSGGGRGLMRELESPLLELRLPGSAASSSCSRAEMSAAASQLRPILCSSAVVELVLKSPSARLRRPCDRQASTEAHRAVMHAESSWVNFLVTASSISCLTSFLTAPMRRAFSSSADVSGPMMALNGLLTSPATRT